MLIKKTYILLAFLSMSFLAFCFCKPFASDKENEDDYKKIMRNTRTTLKYIHYKPATINDNFSEKVFAKYLEFIDPAKRLLLKSDYDYFKKDIHNQDDFFNNEDLTFYFATVDTIYKRIEEVEAFSKEIFEQPMDFTVKEDFVIDPKTIDYAKDKAELKDRWRKYLKYNIMLEIISMQDELDERKKQKDSIGETKENTLDDSDNKKKITKDTPFNEVEKIARDEVKDLILDYFRRLKQRKRETYFSMYMNSFTVQYDPHTVYFSPQDKEDLDISMSGQLEGIGAQLQDKKGYATIASLVVGGPAWKDGRLQVGDQIIKVAQGKKGEAVNIVGMLLDEAIRLIRGKKGTEVILTVKKKDGSQQEISLIRDIIETDETFARSAVITDEKGDKYGIIYLPEFYTSMNGTESRDPSDDILREINELKKENIKGLVMDVRNNPGGSLEEVIEIAGLFIKNGPIVQVKRSDGMMKIHEDRDPMIAYDGPLVVMINELSASASEILAAAMQDYGRAVVVGSPQSFGKGTVQTIFPVDQQNRSEELGALKLTIQKFYRVNGGSTQLRGVNSDIAMVDQYTYSEINEGSRKESLPWDQIAALNIERWKPEINLQTIIERSKARLSDNANLRLIDESAKFMKSLEDTKSIPLNLEDYKKFRDGREKNIEKFEVLDKYKNKLKFSNTQRELQKIKNDTVLKTRRENWHKSLEKDLYLEESIHVLRDIRR
ncbi:carboxy terminal-processing peptidase [Vaginella massiliensis]|uniref:carboxy terminal-processing peptidase n=1 Tax=Vaginella massiliensis TaxID=1816680 RepID=UPI000A87A5F1|nr:carboxy terminal-processing peptidase [Vaginella massiliensis]